MLSGLWMQMAIRGGFNWFEGVSSTSNVMDKPSKGVVPDCPCGWRLREVLGAACWGRSDGSGPGRPWPALRCLPALPSLGLLRLGDAHGVWGDVSGAVGCSNMSC